MGREWAATIGADAGEEEVDSTIAGDLLFVGLAFRLLHSCTTARPASESSQPEEAQEATRKHNKPYEIRGVAVEDVDVLLGDIDVIEQVTVHERPVGLGVVARQTWRGTTASTSRREKKRKEK
jgi:hypothetical protein